MAGLLGRSQFFEETADLFTDEKTAKARAKVVEWLNQTALAENQTKCELIAKIQEVIIGSCIELLDEFWDDIISMVHNSSADVRKTLVGFIEQVCKEKSDFIPRVTNILSMLLRDESAQVIKRVIQACGSIYKNGLQWICNTSDEINDSTEQAWNTLSLIKAQILDMIDNDNDGIRTNAIKFLEGIVIAQSYPDEDSQKREHDFSLEDVPLTLKLIRRRKLEEEADHIFDILLKFHATMHISSVNLIACTGSLCTIAKLRPSLMGPVVEAIKQLNSNLPPTLTDSQMNSVRKSLKMQLLNLLKNRGSFEFHGTIKSLLLNLGSTLSEIQRTIPKMDKHEQQRRQKRINENSLGCVSKKARMDIDNTIRDVAVTPKEILSDSRTLEIDVDEVNEQNKQSTRTNEKCIAEILKNHENVVQLVIDSMKHLPDENPSHFLHAYSPIREMTLNQQIAKISNLLAEQMSEKRIGPGASFFTKDPPMRPIVSKEEELQIIQSAKKEKDEDMSDMKELDENQRKEEATKKLRENMERAKGEQAVIQRMKQRAKALKLQEVTKPLSRATKGKFLHDSVQRILNSERQCAAGGVAAKRRKILTVMAATFPDNVRYFIFEFIMADLKARIDLAFSWLYEEYCLFQGFTRHSYVKSEHRPDYAYNELLSQIINGIITKCDFKDKLILLRKLFMESPLLPDEAVNQLIAMCESDDLGSYSIDLIKDLAILRPPRKQKFVSILLTFCVHEVATIRERALASVVALYVENKLLTANIQDFALKWLSFLEKETPPAEIYSEEYGRPIPYAVWKEEITKICLSTFLALLPHNDELLQNLSQVYTSTSADHKRTILRSIEVPIKIMGCMNKAILQLIEQCPKGVETLITRIIYILTERSTPTPDLVAKVRELYQTKVNDVRLLIPVLSGLTKSEILNTMPKFLKLNPIVVKEVFNRLLGVGSEYSSQNMPITPSEILVALHTIDSTKCELKFIVKATSICLGEKDVYSQETLGACLQQLVEITPLPTLLMRTIIQSLSLYPRLAGFVVNLLQRLILKQVWKQKVIWDGFLKCAQRLKPQSLPVLIQLPAQQLLDALTQCPDLRQPLLEYAQSITERQVGTISQQTMDILTGNTVDVFITDETGGYISVENIKKEIDDESLFSQVGQPLPPGAE